MEMLWICLAIIVLYARTWNYNYNIDDNVPRNGYLNTIPQQLPSPEFFNSKPPKTARVVNIGIHCINTALIEYLFGWKVALLFGIHPISVNGTAWITGNYYATTALFTLTGMFFIEVFGNVYAYTLAAVFFWAAMRSTITSIGLPLYYVFVNPIASLPLFAVVVEYVTSKRFRDGIKLRHADRDKLTWRKIPVAIKVIGYYIQLAFVPHKLAFFHELGYDYDRNKNQKEKTEAIDKRFWISFGLILLTVIIGVAINWKATLFFFALISAFGQYKVMGQFIAERYLYLPMVGLLALVAAVAPTEIFWLYVGALLYKAWTYVPTFKNIEELYKNSAETFPNCPTGHCALASHYFNTDLSKVFPSLNSALKAEPRNFETHLNLSSYYLLGKQPRLAKSHLDVARDCFKDIEQPDFEDVLDNQEKSINDLFRGKKLAV